MKWQIAFIALAAVLSVAHGNDDDMDKKMCENSDWMCNNKLAVKYVNM
eukprot:IDg12584t1